MVINDDGRFGADGAFDPAPTRSQCIRRFMLGSKEINGPSWRTWQRWGYRCRQVEVREIKGK
jgi:hypothetical protein